MDKATPEGADIRQARSGRQEGVGEAEESLESCCQVSSDLSTRCACVARPSPRSCTDDNEARHGPDLSSTSGGKALERWLGDFLCLEH